MLSLRPRRRIVASAAVVLLPAATVIALSGGTASAATPAAGSLVTVPSSKVLDTRSGLGVRKGSVGGHKTITVRILGRGHVPATGAAGVRLSVSAISPAGGGGIRVYPTGVPTTLPAVDFAAHSGSTTSTVITRTGSNGSVTLMNTSSKPMQIAASVTGYVVAGIPDTARAVVPVGQTRVLDTGAKLGTRTATLAKNASVTVQLTGVAGVPVQDVDAVMVNLRTVNARSGGALSEWRSGSKQSLHPLVRYAGRTNSGHALTLAVPSSGKVVLHNNGPASVQLTVDVQAYRLVNPIGLPAASNSHYLRTTNTTTISNVGCADARANGSNNPLELLDIGAQSVTSPLSASAPGVRLTTDSAVRVGYAQLRSMVNSYINGYKACRAAGATVTVGLVANSDGVFSGTNAYPASTRGADWANQVVDPVAGSAPSGVTVIGAFDAEADFFATAAQAIQWEQAYLANTGGKLLFVGAASNCPTTLGQTRRSCGPVNIDNDPANGTNQWSQAQLFQMAYGVSTSRILAMPQIYAHGQSAIQWANIARSGNTGAHHMNVVGALTGRAADLQTAHSFVSQDPASASYDFWNQLQTSSSTAVRKFTWSTDLNVVS